LRKIDFNRKNTELLRGKAKRTKSALQSVSLLWLGSVLGSSSTFILFIIIARELGTQSYGVFGAAFSIATIASLVAHFGVPQVWLKAFGSRGWAAMSWVKPSFIILIFSTFISCTLLFAWAYYAPHEENVKSILQLFTVFVVGQVAFELMVAKLQLEERYVRIACLQFLPNTIRLTIVVIYVYVLGEPITVEGVALVYALVGFLIFAFCYNPIKSFSLGNFFLVTHSKFPKQGGLQKTGLKQVFSETWPFGCASALAYVYLQIDIVMLKYICGDFEAGIYNVGFVILTATMLLPVVLFSKFLMPKYHRWATHDREKFYAAYKDGNLLMLLSGCIVMFMLLYLSDKIVPLIFGAEYTESVDIVKVLAVSIPFYFIAYSVGATLVTKNNMLTKVKVMAFVAIFNVVTNGLLIPFWGAIGAAIATLLSNMLLMCIYFYFAKSKVFVEV